MRGSERRVRHVLEHMSRSKFGALGLVLSPGPVYGSTAYHQQLRNVATQLFLSPTRREERYLTINWLLPNGICPPGPLSSGHASDGGSRYRRPLFR